MRTKQALFISLALGLCLLYAISWALPSATAGISLGYQVTHSVRRCLQPFTFTCMPGDWRHVAGEPGMQGIRAAAPVFQQVVTIPRLLGDERRSRLLAAVRDPAFRWTTKRHRNYPTTDQELYLLPYYDKHFQRLLRDELFPGYAAFGVNASQLVLLDLFIARYRANAQASLARHVDGACLSFIVQLNDPAEFQGGGTLFDYSATPLSVPGGSALLFSGLLHHQGVRVTQGERIILAGFVGMSAPAESVERLAAMVAEAGGKSFPPSAPFVRNALVSRPELRLNAALLRRHAGASGMRFVRRLADGRVRVPHEDSWPLGAACRHWLATGLLTPPEFGLAAAQPRGRRGAQARIARARAAPAYDQESQIFFVRFVLDAVGAEEVERRLRLANGTTPRSAVRRQAIEESRVILGQAKEGEWVDRSLG